MRADSSALVTQHVSDLGLENVTVETKGEPRIAYENRRYRHTADVLGLLSRETGGPLVGFERRLGIVAASIEVQGTQASPTFRVRYPSDADFPRPPKGPVSDPTPRTVDLLVRPLFSYELGRITAPIQVQIQLEPLVRYNPWPGARATASVLIPVYNTFDFSELHPDVENVRPGMASLDQFLWIPRTALASASVGMFGDNRYGMSAGMARPIAGGRLLADAQIDLTGFVSFATDGISYSPLEQWSSFGGLTWSIPVYDAALRLRAGQFLYGDHGVNLEFRRSFGDFDYALFVVHSSGLRNVEGVRVSLPIPPMQRSTREPVRIAPIERFPISYRTDATPVGQFVNGVASREDYLRQLNEPALMANRQRFSRGIGSPPPHRPETGPVDWINISGTSGFIFTPWAGALADRTISLDYSHIPKKWSIDGRGEHVNQTYALSIGLLPRVEANLRFTRIPGDVGFVNDPDNQLTTDTDHMASGRLVLLTPKPNRPGLAVGIEDINGSRRFHSSYVVSGLPLKIKDVQTRFSLGYAPRVFTAARHVLDGGFGAVEVSPWRAVAGRIEYDTEKWNAGIGVVLPYGLRFRASALNLETLSVGAGWTHEL